MFRSTTNVGECDMPLKLPLSGSSRKEISFERHIGTDRLAPAGAALEVWDWASGADQGRTRNIAVRILVFKEPPKYFANADRKLTVALQTLGMLLNTFRIAC